MVQTVCERDVRSPGTCFYQVADADRSLVPLDRGLSGSGPFEQLSAPCAAPARNQKRALPRRCFICKAGFHILRRLTLPALLS